MTTDLTSARLFLPRPKGAGQQDWIGGELSGWNPQTGQNTVVVSGVSYTDLPITNPSTITNGPVLLARTATRLVVIGMLATVGGADALDPIRYRHLTTDLPAVVSSTTMRDATGLSFLVAADVAYALDGAIFYQAPDVPNLSLAFTAPDCTARWGAFGLVSTGAVGIDDWFIETKATEAVGDANFQIVDGNATPRVCLPHGWFAFNAPGQLQLRFAQGASDAGSTIIRAGSWLRLTTLGLSAGLTTTSKIYTATASRSYDGSGNPIGSPDQDNNIYRGDFRSFGNERAIVIMPGATMRADMAGPISIVSAKLWLNAFVQETGTSAADFDTATDTVVPATLAGPAASTGTVLTPDVIGWGYLDATSIVAAILAGDNALVLKPSTFGFYGAGFRGFGAAVGTRPYLEVTYIS